jgi:hypothetical protein
MSIQRRSTLTLRRLAVFFALLSLPAWADAGQVLLFKVTARKGSKTFKTTALFVYYDNQISGREVRTGKQIQLGTPELTRLEVRGARYTFHFPPACKGGKPRVVELDDARLQPSFSLRDPSLCRLAPDEVVLEPMPSKSPDCSMSKALRAKVTKLEKECEAEGGCGDFEPCSFAYAQNYKPCEQLFPTGPIEGEPYSIARLEGPDYDPKNRAQTIAACRAGIHDACTNLLPNRQGKIRCHGRFSNGTGFGTWAESEAECMLHGYLQVLGAQCSDGIRLEGQVRFAPEGAPEKWLPIQGPPSQAQLESIPPAPATP